MRAPLELNPIATPTQEAYDNMPLEFTDSQATSAAFELAMNDTLATVAARAFSKNEMDSANSRRLSPAEANSMFPDMTTPFREEVSPYTAQMLYTRDQEKKVLEERIRKGPQDTWNAAKQLGVGVLAHMMDPMEFGVGAVSGWGVGAAIGRGALGAAAASRALQVSSGTASIGTRLGFSAVESLGGNLIENIASEGAIAGVTNAEGGEYDIQQGMMNVTLGTFFGMVPGMVIKEGSHQLARLGAKFLRSTSPEADRMIVQTTVSAAEQNKVPNPERIVKALAQETDASPGASPRDVIPYAPLTKGTPHKTGKFYVVEGAEGGRAVGDTVGLGRQVTDDPSVAQKTAQRSLSDGKGAIREYDLADMNPVDLNRSLSEVAESDPALLSAFETALKAVDEELDLKDPNATLLEAARLLEAIEEDLSPDAIRGTQVLKAELQKLGFDSTVHNGKNRGGFEHSPHNVVEVFDDSKLGEGRPVELDPREAPAPTAESTRQALDEATGNSQRWDMDEEEARVDFEEAQKVDLDEDAVHADNLANEFIEELEELDKMGQLPETLQNELMELKKFDKEIEYAHTLAKAASVCVVG